MWCLKAGIVQSENCRGGAHCWEIRVVIRPSNSWVSVCCNWLLIMALSRELYSLYNFMSDCRENTASNISSVASLLSLCVYFSMCIPPVVGRWISKHVSVSTCYNRRIVVCVILYAVNVISKASGWLVLPRTYCLHSRWVRVNLFSSIFFFMWFTGWNSIALACECVVACSEMSIISVHFWNRLVKANFFIPDVFLTYFWFRRLKMYNKVQRFALGFKPTWPFLYTFILSCVWNFLF
jgi:hypothetical protein